MPEVTTCRVAICGFPTRQACGNLQVTWDMYCMCVCVHACMHACIHACVCMCGMFPCGVCVCRECNVIWCVYIYSTSLHTYMLTVRMCHCMTMWPPQVSTGLHSCFQVCRTELVCWKKFSTCQTERWWGWGGQWREKEDRQWELNTAAVAASAHTVQLSSVSCVDNSSPCPAN